MKRYIFMGFFAVVLMYKNNSITKKKIGTILLPFQSNEWTTNIEK